VRLQCRANLLSPRIGGAFHRSSRRHDYCYYGLIPAPDKNTWMITSVNALKVGDHRLATNELSGITRMPEMTSDLFGGLRPTQALMQW
jgi:hypothetical protein